MRHLNLKLLFVITLSTEWLIQAYSQQTKQPAKPNIIFIIADDVSIDDIGCYGNPSIKTPNIDNLAKNGLRFTNMFVTSSSCSPSRTSILTGRYPHNTGAAELHTALPSHLTFFPELLKQHGYHTALLGKWHEGKDAFIQPRAKEEFYIIQTDSLHIKNKIYQPSFVHQIEELKKILKKWQEQTGDTQPKRLTPDWYDRQTGKPLPAKDIRGEMPGASVKADYINKKGPC